MTIVYESIRVLTMVRLSFTKVGVLMVRTGRPRKSADLRDVTVSCRLTQAEWEYLDGLVLNEGYSSLNDLLRSLLLAGMPAPQPDASKQRSPG